MRLWLLADHDRRRLGRERGLDIGHEIGIDGVALFCHDRRRRILNSRRRRILDDRRRRSDIDRRRHVDRRSKGLRIGDSGRRSRFGERNRRIGGGLGGGFGRPDPAQAQAPPEVPDQQTEQEREQDQQK
ncbi:hypothetical protein [Dactylosporangium sp. NPDC049140]|uniref:hypothetical protein n=1 Tax=Dactylosporangium sp. NPDC049140 TaxID=3155647 RepID=UPI0033DCB362